MSETHANLLSMQDAMIRLQEYWASSGCLIWQPYNTEVGAGTMNPATFLRVLGPEPWRVGYVEPSVRPDDSRYGDNPNRVQMHTQYQVILKPDPGNPQEIYLKSLAALGIDVHKHDLRFVEDNWESPALGAWGLGWEVWLDGLEITQFTYFQQAGGISLDPVSVEITYGLERIIMAIQGARHFKKIAYTDSLSYGELYGQNEYEMSCYYLNEADVETMNRLFELYLAESRRLLEKELPIPAYTYLLKLSHVFNVLDARGVVGVSDRARYFQMMRALAREVASLWLKRREEQGSPLGTAPAATPQVPSAPVWDESGPCDLLVEIGCEELPPGDLDRVVSTAREEFPKLLASQRILHEGVVVDGTPRRIAMMARRVVPRQQPEERTVKGPSVKHALDAQGNPTKALTSFAAKNKAEVGQLERRAFGAEEYFVAVVSSAQEPSGEVLRKALPAFLGRLSFDKAMRWNSSQVAFSRPVRWLVAMLGKQAIPFEFAGAVTGSVSRGLRFARESNWEDHGAPLAISDAGEYERIIEGQSIMLDTQTRRKKIIEMAEALATEVAGRIAPDDLEDLVAEVTNLVEAPVPLRGGFRPEYLEMPREVLVTVMRKHQRYFAVNGPDGKLLPYFVTVANGLVDSATVIAGNEAVLEARFADASFFMKEDLQQSLESFRPKLAGIVFEHRIGSFLEKSDRVVELSARTGELLGLSDAERNVLSRAAFLCKADLAAQVVMELPKLSGMMGAEYARRGGEPPEVATAIAEHILPKYPGDAMPVSKTGLALAIADRVDTLISFFAAGLEPKSTADPYGLRRVALSLALSLSTQEIDLDLHPILEQSSAMQKGGQSAEVIAGVLNFMDRRLEQYLIEQGYRYDFVRAVLQVRGANPGLAQRTVRELQEFSQTERYQPLIMAYSRVARIIRGTQPSTEVNPVLFEAESEKRVWEACCAAEAVLQPHAGFAEFAALFEPLVPPITDFFVEVMVMCEDEKLRANRLNLLNRVARLGEPILDFTMLQEF